MVVSNTTPLFAFAALGRFDLLEKVHGRIVVVETVVQEYEVGGPITVPDLRFLPWIQIEPAPSHADVRFQMLDAGERDTLSIAMERGASKVLIDERLGRNLAEAHGLSVVGTLVRYDTGISPLGAQPAGRRLPLPRTIGDPTCRLGRRVALSDRRKKAQNSQNLNRHPTPPLDSSILLFLRLLHLLRLFAAKSA